MKIIKNLKTIWLKFGEFLGNVFGSIILALIYILIIGPLKLISILFRKDFLGKRFSGRSYWLTPGKKNIDTLEELQLPF